MRTAIRSPLFLTLGLALTTACGGAKMAAEKALATADSAVAAVAPTAEKVVPEALAPLNQSLAQAKDALAKGDFVAVTAAVADLPAKATELAALAKERTSQITSDWQVLSADMPKNLKALSDKLATVTKMRKLPAGVTAEGVEAAKATVAEAGTAWDKAAAAFKAGDLANAMTEAMNLRSRVDQAMSGLGMASGDRAWGNLMTPTK
jgi:hypothetical protein